MAEFVPQHILYNANIVTVDDRFSAVEALAVYDGRIVALGGDSEIRSLAGHSTRMTDLHGRCVIPGQVDGYAHFVHSGVDLLGDRGKVNIVSLQSVGEIVAAVAERAEQTPPGEWIATSCMYRGALEEGRWPTKDDLDAAAPQHPVHLMQGGRPIIANSRALALAGITRDTPDPTDMPGHIVRAANGEPTGQLIAGAADMARKAWSANLGETPEHWDFSFFDRDTLVDAIAAQQRLFHACGVTTVRDSTTTPREVAALLQARDTGVLKTRTAMAIMLPLEHRSGDARRRLVDSYFEPWSLGSDLLWTWGVSFHYTHDGYEVLDEEELGYYISEAERRGWAVAITPSIGGPAEPVSTILQAVENLGASKVARERGWTFYHPEALRQDNHVSTAAALGMSVNPNPLLNYYAAARSLHMHEQVKASGLHLGLEDDPMAQTRSMWGMATRDWLDAGLSVSMGSNSPAAIYDPDRPFLGQYCILTGDTLAGELLPGQAIERKEMLQIATINGGRALGRDQHLGSLECGKYADLVVVDHDLLTCEDRAVADTKVLQTYVGGELVYER